MTTRDELGTRVRQILISHLEATPRLGRERSGAVTEQAALVCDLSLDSLDLIDVAMAIEEAFDIELDDDVVRGCITVAELAEHLADRLGLAAEAA